MWYNLMTIAIVLPISVNSNKFTALREVYYIYMLTLKYILTIGINSNTINYGHLTVAMYISHKNNGYYIITSNLISNLTRKPRLSLLSLTTSCSDLIFSWTPSGQSGSPKSCNVLFTSRDCALFIVASLLSGFHHIPSLTKQLFL